jgi:cell wall-associated NlpC family hydrolase
LQTENVLPHSDYDPPVPRTFSTLVSAAVLVALVAVAAAFGQGGDSASSADLTARAAPAARQLPPAGVTSVPSASGAVLAEMNRRLGTPRRVALSARKRAQALARIERRIRAQQRAAAARRAAAAAATPAGAPYWFDAQAAAQTTSGPTSPDEAQWLNSGQGGWVESSGYARAPVNAPEAVKRVIQAGNLIARSPYLWGGGHGAWLDRGYDCSGSVSYALAAGGMLGYTQTSGQLMNWGVAGPGRWLTIYANQGHVFMYVAGLRFDTSGRAGDHASRWQLAPRSADGFAMRHYPGL